MKSGVWGLTARNKMPKVLPVVANAACIALGIVSVSIVAHFTPLLPLDFDQAFNLQVAYSLATHFAYINTYVPSIVYDPHVTSNGLMQYFAAGLWRISGSMEVAREGSLVMGMALLTAALYLVRPWLTCLPAVLLLCWPSFFLVSTAFVGEIWELAFLLFGLNALLRAPLDFDVRHWSSRWALFVASLCFALSIASKLLAVSIVLPLVLGVTFSRARPLSAQKLARVVVFTLLIVALTSVFFVMQFAFSVVHTTHRPFDISQVASSLSAFVRGHIGQANASKASALSWAAQMAEFQNVYVPLLVIVMGALLVAMEAGYLPLLAAAFVLWGYYGLNERRMLPMAFAIVVLGALSAEDALSRISVRFRMPPAPVKAAALVSACFFFVGVSAAAHVPSPAALAAHRGAPGTLDRTVQTSRGRFVYSPHLIAVLKRYRYVLASGWWQFPDITIRHRMRFYDRMAAVNAGIPPSQAVLIFDRGNHSWPITSEKGNCQKQVYVDGPIVVCAPRSDVALNYQPPATATAK